MLPRPPGSCEVRDGITEFAARQSAASSAIPFAMSTHVLLSLLNTRLFRSFQIVQAIRVAIVSNPQRCGLWTFSLALHNQVWKDASFIGRQSCSLIARSAHHHSCLDSGQATKMWSMVSLCWSQSTHHRGCGSPRLRRRSAVQHLFSATNQRKYRQRGGAREFHIGADWNWMRPKKRAW